MKVDLTKYDNIIFDFGGVILDINPELTREAFIKIGGIETLQSVEKSDILWQFERGELSGNKMYDEISKHLDKNISKAEFLKAWNALLLDYKPDRIAEIKKLSKSHKLFLLSNTNELHFNSFSAKLKEEYQVTFDDLFSEVYLSCKMGLIKPDPKIYESVISDAEIIPERTLFIEDTPKNAEAAEKLGMDTLVIPRNGSFYNYFKG